MRYHRFLMWAVIPVVVVCGWLRLSANASGAPAADETRPNILLLVTDDHRWDALGCMGNPIIKTPNLDALATGGVLFENAFATTSICCSSRASIITGQYTRRNKIWQFNQPLSPGTSAAVCVSQ